MRMKIALLAIETPLGRGMGYVYVCLCVCMCMVCVWAGRLLRSNDRGTQIAARNLCFVSISYGKLVNCENQAEIVCSLDGGGALETMMVNFTITMFQLGILKPGMNKKKGHPDSIFIY